MSCFMKATCSVVSKVNKYDVTFTFEFVFTHPNENRTKTIYSKSKVGKDQESIQPSTTPDPGHHMGK